MDEYKFVTVLIVMRNEEEYIEECLLSVINQDYPKNRYEIIIVDGESTDNSLEIVRKYVDKYNIRIITNSKRNLASGWNLGIKSAKGEIVIRPDAHSTIEPNFITESIKTLTLKKDAICVGGKINSISKGGFIAKSVSNILASPFGVGNSQFRVGSSSKYVDTVAYGAYRKYIFDKCGYFNEDLDRNQDLEMHSRIKKIGGKFYFNPEIKSNYYTRSTIKGFIKQAYKNGKWNIITLNWQIEALSLRHLIPLFFVTSLILNSILSIIFSKWKIVLLLEIILYLTWIILGSLKICKKEGLHYFLLSPILFFCLHLSYGIGSLYGTLPLYKLIRLRKH